MIDRKQMEHRSIGLKIEAKIEPKAISHFNNEGQRADFNER